MAEEIDLTNFVKFKEARNLAKVSSQTLRNWDNEGKIRTIRTPSNYRLFHKDDLVSLNNLNNGPAAPEQRIGIVYARVSTKKQEDDLERQVQQLSGRRPKYKIYKDIGSGLNWKRKGFREILEQVMQRKVSEVVVLHRDRLARFCFEFIEWIITSHGCKLTVLNKNQATSPQAELTEDILSILHVYSCKEMGRRAFKKFQNPDLSDEEADLHDKKLAEL